MYFKTVLTLTEKTTASSGRANTAETSSEQLETLKQAPEKRTTSSPWFQTNLTAISYHFLQVVANFDLGSY